MYIKYINKDEIFRCRRASKIVFAIENTILTIYTDRNLKYKYDQLQKKFYRELQIIYLEIRNFTIYGQIWCIAVHIDMLDKNNFLFENKTIEINGEELKSLYNK